MGTALAISPRVLGQDRDASHGGYAYREVYSRIYVESIVGFKWAGIVLNSALVEAFIGSTAKEVFTEALRKCKRNNLARKARLIRRALYNTYLLSFSPFICPNS